MRLRLVGAALWMLASCGLAQTDAGGARYLSQAELLNQAKTLLIKSRTDPRGIADIMLATYPGHSVWMVARPGERATGGSLLQSPRTLYEWRVTRPECIESCQTFVR